MSITVTFKFECSGCFKSVEVDGGRLHSNFHGISGGNSADAEKVCPEGWMAFDPYTRCTYCPDCVAAIWPDPEEWHGIRVVRVGDGGQQQ